MTPAEIRADLDTIRAAVEVSTSDRVWRLLGRIASVLAVPAMIGAGSWLSDLGARVEQNHDRLTVIESSRFTSNDGRDLVDALRQEIRTNYPPEWLRQAIARIEIQQSRTAAKLEELDDRLDRLEAGK
jgi:hypothetical protein